MNLQLFWHRLDLCVPRIGLVAFMDGSLSVDQFWNEDISLVSASRSVPLAREAPRTLNDLIKFLGIPLWGYLLIVGLCAMFFWCPAFEAIFPKLSDIDQSLNKIDVHLGTIDGSLNILIPRLARASFSEAEQNASKSNAVATVSALVDAGELVSKATTLQVPAQPLFFEDVINSLNRLATSPVSGSIEQQIHNARLALAQYRSSIETVPPLPQRRVLIYQVQTIRGGAPKPARIIWNGPPQIDMFTIPLPEPPSVVSAAFENVALENGWQKLDNAAWQNVTFVNMHLSYEGGNLVLFKVRFIKCTFEVSYHHPNAKELLDYAALNNQELRLGFNFPPRIMTGRNGL
jgi:hypothetical protein